MKRQFGSVFCFQQFARVSVICFVQLALLAGWCSTVYFVDFPKNNVYCQSYRGKNSLVRGIWWRARAEYRLRARKAALQLARPWLNVKTKITEECSGVHWSPLSASHTTFLLHPSFLFNVSNFFKNPSSLLEKHDFILNKTLPKLNTKRSSKYCSRLKKNSIQCSKFTKLGQPSQDGRSVKRSNPWWWLACYI